MKIEIYREKEQEQEKVVRLRLIDQFNTVYLVAVDEYGNTAAGGNLLYISPEGGICRVSNVSKSIGLPLDDKRRVIID